jgi:hypothetical protein
MKVRAIAAGYGAEAPHAFGDRDQPGGSGRIL